MIIGINGKIGSGKDTVGKIIQSLTQGINSNKQILDYCNGVKVTGFDWKIKKFAGKLKQIASLLTGIPVEKFEDQDFKLTNLPEEWSILKQSGRNKVLIPMTVREFLQKLGTEAMRDGLHTNVWVNALFADYKTNAEWFDEIRGNYKEYPNWIITDMRFPNEMEAVKERKGITIRVSRTGVHTPKIEDLHPSETALDNSEFDYHIDNSGTIEELVEKVREILINEKLL